MPGTTAIPDSDLSACRSRTPLLVLGVACLAGLALRIGIGWWLGFLSDLQIYQIWAAPPGEVALPASYKVSPNNYPPLYPSVLRLLYLIHERLHLPGDFRDPLMFPVVEEDPGEHFAAQRPLILLLKTPAMLADMGSAILIYAIAAGGLTPRGGRSARWAGVLAACFYLFNPAILYDGAYYGQTDTVLIFLLLLAIWAYLAGRPVRLGAAAMAALLFKAQAFVVLIVLSAAVIGQWRTVWRPRAPRLLAGAAGCLAGVAVLAAATGQLQQFYDGYFTIVGFFPLVTSRAFNLWWLLTRPWDKAPFEADFPRDDALVMGLLSYRSIGLILFLAGLAVILWRLHRAGYTPLAVLLAAAATGWAFFNLPTEMHERYAVPAIGTMCLLPLWDRRWYLLTLIPSLTVTFNITNLAPLHCPPWPALAYYFNWFIWPEQQVAWTIFAIIHVLMLPLCLEALWRAGSPAFEEAKGDIEHGF